MNEAFIPEVSIPDLPFIIDENTEVKALVVGGSNSHVYELQINGHIFIIKDVELSSQTYNIYPGESVFEKAKNMKTFFDVVKKHLGDSAIDTSFMVAKNSKGEQIIRIIQKKVNGWCLRDIEERLNPEMRAEIQTRIVNCTYELETAFADKQLNQADFSKAIDWVRQDALFDKNIYITKADRSKGEESKIALVDLI